MRHLGSGSTSRLGPGPKGSRAPPTSSPGAAASTFFHFAGEVVGANGSRAPITDPAAGWPARPPLTQRAAMVSPGGRPRGLGAWEVEGCVWTWHSWLGGWGWTAVRASGAEQRATHRTLVAAALGRSQRPGFLVLRRSFTFFYSWGKGERKAAVKLFSFSALP